MRVVLSCGDGRLDEHLDKTYNDGNTLFIRNAGANAILAIPALEEMISRGVKITEAIVVPHTDSVDVTKGCGAMGLSAQEDPDTTEEIKEVFISQFRDSDGRPLFTSRKHLESEVNPDLQVAELKGFFKGQGLSIPVRAELADTHELEELGEIAPHMGSKVLLIADTSTTPYSTFLKEVNKKLVNIPASNGGGERSLSDLYVLQTRPSFDMQGKITPDPLTELQAAIFVRHVGTKTVMFVSETPEGKKRLEVLADQLKVSGLTPAKMEVLELGGHTKARKQSV